jgi:hypothetical protein
VTARECLFVLVDILFGDNSALCGGACAEGRRSVCGQCECDGRPGESRLNIQPRLFVETRASVLDHPAGMRSCYRRDARAIEVVDSAATDVDARVQLQTKVAMRSLRTDCRFLRRRHWAILHVSATLLLVNIQHSAFSMVAVKDITFQLHKGI